LGNLDIENVGNLKICERGNVMKDFYCLRGFKTREEAQEKRCPVDKQCKKCTVCCGGTSFENCNNSMACPQTCQTFPSRSVFKMLADEPTLCSKKVA
jgi:hypothetical protein